KAAAQNRMAGKATVTRFEVIPFSKPEVWRSVIFLRKRGVSMKKHLLLCLSLGLTASTCQAVYAQAADGIYTADQAKRGEAAFKKQCSSCHGEALDGVAPSPPLSGDA